MCACVCVCVCIPTPPSDLIIIVEDSKQNMHGELALSLVLHETRPAYMTQRLALRKQVVFKSAILCMNSYYNIITLSVCYYTH